MWWVVLTWEDPTAGGEVLVRTGSVASTPCARGCDSNGLLSSGCCDSIWLPSIELPNLVAYDQDQLPRYRINANASSGVVTWSTRLVGTWYAPLDFRAYPFDHQHLLMEMTIADSQSHAVGLKWEHVAKLNNTAHTKGADLAGWRVKWAKGKIYDSRGCQLAFGVTAPRYDGVTAAGLDALGSGNASSSTSSSTTNGTAVVAADSVVAAGGDNSSSGSSSSSGGSSSGGGVQYVSIGIPDRFFADNAGIGTTVPEDCGVHPTLYDEARALYGPIVLVADIMVKRVSSYFLLTNLVPVLVVSLASLVSYCMPCAALGERIGVITTMILSLTALQFVFDTPPANYINALQSVVLASYLLMAIAVAEALVVNRLVGLSSSLTNKRSCVRKYSTLLSSRQRSRPSASLPSGPYGGGAKRSATSSLDRRLAAALAAAAAAGQLDDPEAAAAAVKLAVAGSQAADAGPNPFAKQRQRSLGGSSSGSVSASEGKRRLQQRKNAAAEVAAVMGPPGDEEAGLGAHGATVMAAQRGQRGLGGGGGRGGGVAAVELVAAAAPSPGAPAGLAAPAALTRSTSAAAAATATGTPGMSAAEAAAAALATASAAANPLYDRSVSYSGVGATAGAYYTDAGAATATAATAAAAAAPANAISVSGSLPTQARLLQPPPPQLPVSISAAPAAAALPAAGLNPTAYSASLALAANSGHPTLPLPPSTSPDDYLPQQQPPQWHTPAAPPQSLQQGGARPVAEAAEEYQPMAQQPQQQPASGQHRDNRQQLTGDSATDLSRRKPPRPFDAARQLLLPLSGAGTGAATAAAGGSVATSGQPLLAAGRNPGAAAASGGATAAAVPRGPNFHRPSGASSTTAATAPAAAAGTAATAAGLNLLHQRSLELDAAAASTSAPPPQPTWRRSNRVAGGAGEGANGAAGGGGGGGGAGGRVRAAAGWLAACWGGARGCCWSTCERPMEWYSNIKEDPELAMYVAVRIDKWTCGVSFVLYVVCVTVLLWFMTQVGDHKLMLGDRPGNM
ncbi:hypothetical protein HXX76_005744 [Chlamydomonas incerta]|uniref:Neurotransmitter-gated ion-channel ligand-binding domain-containing protein n=1 Tax=Chlamydomonas incerta TaxID=51695 RepID=A0A835TG79_CHLIN|nr:hypothetical protein HXX76_005744 [Chlamydomonas incerta]|eukprot:KAG2438135.1 hypothetical protein HXX76_005744 [Chlamydomonas incerta]